MINAMIMDGTVKSIPNASSAPVRVAEFLPMACSSKANSTSLSRRRHSFQFSGEFFFPFSRRQISHHSLGDFLRFAKKSERRLSTSSFVSMVSYHGWYFAPPECAVKCPPCIWKFQTFALIVLLPCPLDWFIFDQVSSVPIVPTSFWWVYYQGVGL